MLEGRNFTLYSDHQSLIPSLAKKSEPQTARQTYQLAFIAEYTTDIRYLKGKNNVVADALSRPPLGTPVVNHVSQPQPTPELPQTASHSQCISPDASEALTALVNSIGQLSVDLEQMARDQPLDPDYIRLVNDARTSIHLKSVRLSQNQLIVDVSNGPARPLVPLSWRKRIFDVNHGLGHPGIR